MHSIHLYEDFEDDFDYIGFFKSLIDWKFINYLRYRLTEYEDIGCFTRINVVTEYYDKFCNKIGYSDVYAIDSLGKNTFMYPGASQYKEYKKKGLFYLIMIEDDKNSDIKYKYLEDFYNKISGKCDKVFFPRYKFAIIVKIK